MIGSILSKQSFAERNGIEFIPVLKIEKQDPENLFREESLFRCPFY